MWTCHDDIYEPIEAEERDDPQVCEWCQEYYYDDELKAVEVDDADVDYCIMVCDTCRTDHHHEAFLLLQEQKDEDNKTISR